MDGRNDKEIKFQSTFEGKGSSNSLTWFSVLIIIAFLFISSSLGHVVSLSNQLSVPFSVLFTLLKLLVTVMSSFICHLH